MKGTEVGSVTGRTCNEALQFTNAAGNGLLFIGCVVSCQDLQRHLQMSHSDAQQQSWMA